MKPKVYIIPAISMLFSILALFEAFTKSIRHDVINYIKVSSYDTGYLFLLLYVIPVLLIFIHIKSLKGKTNKLYPMGILYSAVGLVLSILVSVRKADVFFDFVVKYHPYIYIFPIFAIAMFLSKMNKKLFLAVLLLDVVYALLLIKYLPIRHLHVNVSSTYTKMAFTYLILVFLHIIAYNKLKWTESRQLT
jgi:uncharacterized protein YacL